MTLFKNVNGKRIKMSSTEESSIKSEWQENGLSPTQAELDAIIDDLTKDIDTGKSLLRALGVKVFKIEKKADPTLTPTKFKKSIRTIVAGF